MVQWSEEKKATWKLIEDQLAILNEIKYKHRAIISGAQPAPEHLNNEEVQEWVREKGNKVRQTLFKESIALVSLQQHFHAIE